MDKDLTKLVWITVLVFAGGGIFVTTMPQASNDVAAPAFAPVVEETVVQPPIRVDSPTEGAPVRSPLVVTGEAVGPWYFEASFPLVVRDADGRVLGESFATAQGDWMTEEYVRFEGIVRFEEPTFGVGSVEFVKDNPSDLPELDDSLEVPVVFR